MCWHSASGTARVRACASATGEVNLWRIEEDDVERRRIFRQCCKHVAAIGGTPGGAQVECSSIASCNLNCATRNTYVGRLCSAQGGLLCFTLFPSIPVRYLTGRARRSTLTSNPASPAPVVGECAITQDCSITAHRECFELHAYRVCRKKAPEPSSTPQIQYPAQAPCSHASRSRASRRMKRLKNKSAR